MGDKDRNRQRVTKEEINKLRKRSERWEDRVRGRRKDKRRERSKRERDRDRERETKRYRKKERRT
jgi:hypothetical protein